MRTLRRLKTIILIFLVFSILQCSISLIEIFGKQHTNTLQWGESLFIPNVIDYFIDRYTTGLSAVIIVVWLFFKKHWSLPKINQDFEANPNEAFNLDIDDLLLFDQHLLTPSKANSEISVNISHESSNSPNSSLIKYNTKRSNETNTEENMKLIEHREN